jgi:hypothetical protein
MPVSIAAAVADIQVTLMLNLGHSSGNYSCYYTKAE